MAFSRTKKGEGAAPDLQHFRERYPLTVASLGALPDREVWLRAVWREESRWRDSLGAAREEVVVRGAPPARLACEGEFEIVYAGAAGSLLDAALMAGRYGRRVLVFDESPSAVAGRRWGVSREEREGLARAGLFTREEIEAATLNRYRAGRVKFHDAGSRVKAPDLEVRDVLDAELDADRLLASARARLCARAGCAFVEGARFVRAYVEPRRVSVEIEAAGARKLFAARLFVDATGAGSPVARQLDGAGALTHVRPWVGTVARGFARGGGARGVDFGVREMMVTTEDASAHRQLLWNGSARDAGRDEFETRLFFYDAVDSPADKSLLALFEQYFEKLPDYKRAGAQWRVVRPLFGYGAGARGRGWKSRARVSSDRVLLAGGGAGGANPLAPSGAHLCELERRTRLLDLALGADALDAHSLSAVACAEPRASHASHLAEFLRPGARAAREPAAVNETLNAVAAALHDLDESVRRELFRDQLSFGALRRLVGRTVRLYPRILQRVREHFGARGTFLWLAHAADAALRERREGRDDAPWAGEIDSGLDDESGGSARPATPQGHERGAGG
ncbi:MAG TPA: hypothetical protein VF538_10425 [Pyrinomonadaceae bacterium]|jgi:lycopene cyclase CruA